MSEILFDELMQLAKTILMKPLKYATMVVAHGVRKTYPELNMKSKQEIDADIEDLFGNSFDKLQLALERRISDAAEKNAVDFEREFYINDLKNNYAAIRDELSVARVKYRDFLRHKVVFTWTEFLAAAGLLDKKMIILHEWITNASPLCQKPLMQGLAEVCDLEQYREWQQDIFLILSEAYLLRVAVHYHTVRSFIEMYSSH